MSFDTQKRKLRTLWESGQGNSNSIDSALLIQGKKESQVKLSDPRVIVMGKFKELNSEWIPLMPKGVQNDGTYSYRAVEFAVQLTIPEDWIPYARLNLAYRRTGSEAIFSGTSIDVIQFCQIISMGTTDEFGLPLSSAVQNLKKVTWNVAFVQNKYYDPPPWYDYEMKLFFTLINPSYQTSS